MRTSSLKTMIATCALHNSFSEAFTTPNNNYHNALHVNAASPPRLQNSNIPIYLIPEQAAELVEAAKNYELIMKEVTEDDLQSFGTSRQTKVSTTVSPQRKAGVSGRKIDKERGGPYSILSGLFAKDGNWNRGR